MRSIRNPDTCALAFLVAFPFVYFWQITLGQQVWFGTDIIRLFHPFGVELSRALNEGRLPLWTPNLLAGFPLLAEGQIAALYPLNWILFRILPAHHALSYSVLLHMAWAGVGMYALVRAFGLRPASALLAGFVFQFNGFIFAHLVHPPIIVAAAWLPWLIFLQTQFLRAWQARARRAGLYFFLASLALGVQFTTGSVQIAFLNVLAFGVIGIFNCFPTSNLQLPTSNPQLPLSTYRFAPPILLGVALPLLFSAGIAAIQIIPTAELVGYSVRGNVSEGFSASYSLPPEFLAQFVAPFSQGEPSESNNEYWGYIGVGAFLLALAAPFLKRDRRTLFFAVFALFALFVSIGDLNPLNQFLFRLPLFNFFRVPARYLLLVVFSGAILAATALDALAERLESRADNRAFFVVIPFAALVLTVLNLVQSKLEFWLDAWKWLSPQLALAAIALVALALTRRISRGVFTAAMLGVVVFDLVSAAPPFTLSLSWVTAPANVQATVRSIGTFDVALGKSRVWTDLSSFPSIPGLRNSLFPNLALTYAKESAQVFSSLAFARSEAFVANPSPAMLNLLNVFYVTIPLEARPKTELPMPPELVALDIVNNEVVIPPTPAKTIEIISFTDQSVDLADGFVAGQVELRRVDGSVEAFPLRLGFETAEWDYERLNVQHRRARVASAFPAFVRAFGRMFEGHTYLARYEFAARDVVGVNVRSFLPPARLIVEDARLVDAGERVISLAALSGKNDFRVAYWSDTVAVWRNENALPRAFIAHSAQVLNDAAAFARMRGDGFRPGDEVLLSDGRPLTDDRAEFQDRVQITRYENERVEIAVSTDREGYLLLADSWYPGWAATVDGIVTEIYRADVLFRAVPMAVGTHTVVFEYRPQSLIVGAMVSAVSLVIASALAFWMRGRLQ